MQTRNICGQTANEAQQSNQVRSLRSRDCSRATLFRRALFEALGIDLSRPVHTFSKWKIFWMAWLGYAVAGIVTAVYVSWIDFKPNGYVGPNSIFVLLAVYGCISGIVFLPLPLLASFSLNGEVRGATKSLCLRSVTLGFLIYVLINVWVLGGRGDVNPVSAIFAVLAVFISSLFMLARRADRNLLRQDPLPQMEQDSGAQLSAPCDRSKPPSA